MTSMLRESIKDMTRVAYSGSKVWYPPQTMIGLSESGHVDVTTNMAIAKHLYSAFSSGEANEIIPRYTATYEGNAEEREPQHVTAQETFSHEIQKALIGRPDPDVADIVKRAAYETFTFHAQQQDDGMDPLKLNDMAGKLGFADFNTFETLLTKTPVKPTLMEEAKHSINTLLSLKGSDDLFKEKVLDENRPSLDVHNKQDNDQRANHEHVSGFGDTPLVYVSNNSVPKFNY